MITGLVIVGSAAVGAIVCTPAPGIVKVIVSRPTVLLASMIAFLSEPAVGFILSPLSAVVVTVKDAALLIGGRASISERPTRLSPNSSANVMARDLLTLILLITISSSNSHLVQ